MILYTPKEVSEILKISYRSVLTLIRDDEIKAIVVPGGYRVRERDLEDYFTYSKANNDN